MITYCNRMLLVIAFWALVAAVTVIGTGCTYLKAGKAVANQAQKDLMQQAMELMDEKVQSSYDWLCWHGSERALHKIIRPGEMEKGYQLLCGHSLMFPMGEIRTRIENDLKQLDDLCEPHD